MALDSAEGTAEPPDPQTSRPLTAQVLATVIGVFCGTTLITVALSLITAPRMFTEAIAASDLIPTSVKPEILQIYTRTALSSMIVQVLAGLALWTTFAVVTARAIARTVETMRRAAQLVASGRFDFALRATQLGPEADHFAMTFNDMAARLNDVEATRRRLLSDLAHELRTPLATLDGYLEAFEDGYLEPDPETLRMMRDQTRRLNRLVADVSSVSRAEEHIDPLRLVPTDPAAMVETAAAAFAHQQEGPKVHVRIDPGLPPLYVDRERMAQVIGNVVNNAMRHGKSYVLLEAYNGRDNTVVIRVSDDGDGIPTDALPHLFERFFRADAARDRHRGGSGIGLSIAKAFVNAHGGSIEASSPGPGMGSTFTITLPVASAGQLTS